MTLSTARVTARVIARRWTGFWFPRERAENLAFARILIAAHALWILLSRDYAAMSGVPEVFWRAAPSTLQWRYLLTPGNPGLEYLVQGTAAIALAGAMLGLYPRLCSAVAAVLLYHLAPLESGIYDIAPTARGLTIAPVALLLLAAAPCGDALALWRPARTGGRRGARPSRRYGWALLLIQLLVVEIYLFSAIGKLERTGLSWGSAEHLQLWLLWFNQDSQSVVFGTLGPWLAQFRWMAGAIGAATVMFEWCMPLALLWRPSRRVLVPMALAFHVGVLFAMNINVPEAWLILVFVEWPGSSARPSRTPPAN